MVQRNVLRFYVLNKNSFNSLGCVAVTLGDTGGMDTGEMDTGGDTGEMAGFDLQTRCGGTVLMARC